MDFKCVCVHDIQKKKNTVAPCPTPVLAKPYWLCVRIKKIFYACSQVFRSTSYQT